jgi:transcription initiation factor TFIID TATA-box-binding protein
MNAEIVNIVAMTNLYHKIDLKDVYGLAPANHAYFKLDNGYNAKHFKRVVWLYKNVKLAFFKSGKILCFGAKTVNQAKTILKKIYNALIFNGFIINTPFNFKVVNIVAKVSLKRYVNLENLALKLDKCIYEPEQYAGLIYKHGKATFLIFANGEAIITGLKNEDEVEPYVNELIKIIDSIETSEVKCLV